MASAVGQSCGCGVDGGRISGTARNGWMRSAALRSAADQPAITSTTHAVNETLNDKLHEREQQLPGSIRSDPIPTLDPQTAQRSAATSG